MLQFDGALEHLKQVARGTVSNRDIQQANADDMIQSSSVMSEH
jgi:hypothetical protein